MQAIQERVGQESTLWYTKTPVMHEIKKRVTQESIIRYKALVIYKIQEGIEFQKHIARSFMLYFYFIFYNLNS